jgi:ABC-type nitrate/sulfonate/bicarbonate transport system permease component
MGNDEREGKEEEPETSREDGGGSGEGEVASALGGEAEDVGGDVAEVGPGRKAWLERWITIRDRPSYGEGLVYGFLCVGLVLLAWHVVTMGPPEERIVNAYTLPSVKEALDSLPSLWFDRAIARGAMWSLGRVLGGFLLAASIAVPLGVLAGSYLRVDAFFRPMSVFGRNVPVAALIPLTLIWFGIGESQKVMFIFLASVGFIFFDSVNAMHQVSGRFLDTAYTLGARQTPRRGAMRGLLIGLGYGVVWVLATLAIAAAQDDARPEVLSLLKRGMTGTLLGFLLWFPIQSHQVISKVMLPLALPHIVNSMRLLFGLAFGYIMLAEVINAGNGIGYIINLSQRQGPREHIYLSLIIIALLAFAIDRVVLWLQHRWFPYNYAKHK